MLTFTCQNVACVKRFLLVQRIRHTSAGGSANVGPRAALHPAISAEISKGDCPNIFVEGVYVCDMFDCHFRRGSWVAHA